MPGPVSSTWIDDLRAAPARRERDSARGDRRVDHRLARVLGEVDEHLLPALTSSATAGTRASKSRTMLDVVDAERVLVERITDSMTSLTLAELAARERDWRANVSRFSTIFLQRRALPSICSMSRRDHCSLGRERKSCAKPRMPDSGLLSSCATPLTISPIAFSFSDCVSWFCELLLARDVAREEQHALAGPAVGRRGAGSRRRRTAARPSACSARNSSPALRGPARGRRQRAASSAARSLRDGELGRRRRSARGRSRGR